MLMKVRIEPIDFFAVDPCHNKIHQELENWARYVTPGRMSWVHPMWRKGRPNGRQWSMPAIREDVRVLEASNMEKTIFALPEKQREALRWCYVYRWSPAVEIRRLGCTYERLAELIRSGRTMLVNRGIANG